MLTTAFAPMACACSTSCRTAVCRASSTVTVNSDASPFFSDRIVPGNPRANPIERAMTPKAGPTYLDIWYPGITGEAATGMAQGWLVRADPCLRSPPRLASCASSARPVALGPVLVVVAHGVLLREIAAGPVLASSRLPPRVRKIERLGTALPHPVGHVTASRVVVILVAPTRCPGSPVGGLGPAASACFQPAGTDDLAARIARTVDSCPCDLRMDAEPSVLAVVSPSRQRCPQRRVGPAHAQ